MFGFEAYVMGAECSRAAKFAPFLPDVHHGDSRSPEHKQLTSSTDRGGIE